MISQTTSSAKPPGLCFGLRERSFKPSMPSERNRCFHLYPVFRLMPYSAQSRLKETPCRIDCRANSVRTSIRLHSFHGMKASFACHATNMSVTYVLNLVCYPGPEPGPLSLPRAMRFTPFPAIRYPLNAHASFLPHSDLVERFDLLSHRARVHA